MVKQQSHPASRSAWSRREFVLSLGALGAGALLSRQRAWSALLEPQHRFGFKELAAGRGIVIGSLADGGNILLIKSDQGPIIVDSKFAHTAEWLLNDIKAHAGEPPALLINTHHHADHSGGNWLLSASAKVAAHKNFNPRIEANLQRYVQGAQDRVSELEEQGASADLQSAKALLEKLQSRNADHFRAKQELPDGVSIIEHGDVRVNTYHYGAGHTDNDLVVHFPEHNIIHMGDLLFHNLHPFIDRSAKANSKGWQNSVRQAMKLANDETIIIPGHGEVTDQSALPRQVEYFDQLRGVVETAMKEGKSKETIAALQPDVFKGRGFERFMGMALSAMYDELAAEMH